MATTEEIYEALRTWDEPPLIHYSLQDDYYDICNVHLVKQIELYRDWKDDAIPDIPIRMFRTFILASIHNEKGSSFIRGDAGLCLGFKPLNTPVTKKILTHPDFVSNLTAHGIMYLRGELKGRRVTMPYEELKEEVWSHGRHMGGIPVAA